MWKVALLLALTLGWASAPLPAQAPVPAEQLYCCKGGLITDRAFGVGGVTVEEGGCSPCSPDAGMQQ
jgi:hypothetical protein